MLEQYGRTRSVLRLVTFFLLATTTDFVTSIYAQDEVPLAPDAPTVSPTTGSTTSLDVSWSAPDNAGRPAIASYDLQYKASTDASFSEGPQDISGTSTTISGLQSGIAYDVQVRATNSVGDGPWSDSGTGSTAVTNTPASGKPTISGSHYVGSSIVVGTVNITDADTIPDPPNFEFQWIRVTGGIDAEILGATSATYRLVAADQGNKVKVEVTFEDALNNEETVVSDAWPDASSIGAQPTISIASGTAEEGNDVSFSVSLSTALLDDVTVEYSTSLESTDTAESSDFSALSNETLTIAANETSAQIAIPTVDDSVDEDTETFSVTLSNSSPNAAISTGTATGTITDNDDPPNMSFLRPNEVDESVGTATVRVRVRDGQSEKTITFQYSTSDSTATAAQDYTPPDESAGEHIVTVPVGTSSFTIPIIDDDIDEMDEEAFFVTLSNVQNANLTSTDTWGVIIHDNDDPPTISINDPSSAVTEGDDVEFPLALAGRSSEPVNVDFTVTSNTATANSDYTVPSPSSVTIPALARSGTITVSSLQDTTAESNETFNVDLTSADNASIDSSANSATGTIADDDPAPKVTAVMATAGDQTLTISWSASSHANGYKVQWKSGSDLYDETNRQATTDASTLNYEINSLSNGTTYTVRVAATRTGIADGAWSDEITATPVGSTPINNEATGMPSISGTARVGKTLTASSGDIDDDDGLVSVSYNYQWIRVDGSTESDIDGAGTATYTLADADVGKKIKVRATFNDNLNNAESRTSDAFPSSGTVRAKPTVKISNTPSATEGNAVVFEIELSETASEDLAVTYSTIVASDDTATLDESAVGGADFTNVSNGSVTIANGQSTAQISIATNDDDVEELNEETFTLELTATNDVELGTPHQVKGTITDNEDVPNVSVAEAVATEGNPVVFTATSNRASALAITVEYSTSNNSATAGSDYVAAAPDASVIITPGNLTGTISISTLDDDIDEPDEHFQLRLDTAENAAIPGSTQAARGVIEDNDPEPTVSIAAANATEGSTVDFTVSLSEISGKDNTITYSTADGSALDGTDYTGTSSSTIDIAAGMLSGTISVPTTDDSAAEGDETFTVTISSATNATVPTDGTQTATGTINDDDSSLTVTINDAVATEGSNVTFTVTLSEAAPAGGVVVTYSTSIEGSNNASSDDFTAASGATVTIAANTTTADIDVATIDDSTDEVDETFTLRLTGATGASLGSQSTGTGTINDNDSAPTLSIAAASANEGTRMDFTVTPTPLSGKNITVGYVTSAVTAEAGTDYIVTTGVTVNIAPGGTGTISIQTTSDEFDEDDETFTVTLSNPTNATLGTAKTATGTIFDDDDPPSLTIESGSATEGSTIYFTVTPSVPSEKEIKVHYSTNDVTATADVDYTSATDQELTIVPTSLSESISIDTLEDGMPEDDETFTVMLSNPTNATLGTATATGTINDDDDLIVTVQDASATEGSAVAFTVSLSANAPAAGVVVTYSTSVETGDTASIDANAIGGVDFTTVTGQTVTIPSGSSSTTISVSTGDDSTDEEDETFTLTLTNATNAALGSPSKANGTITDNDAAPNVSITGGSALEGDDVQFTVTSTAASAKTITVPYSTGNGTASAPGDFTAPDANASVTIAAGDTEATITIPTIDDSTSEDEESFTVTLGTPTNAGLGTSAATGTITDDDLEVTLANASGTEGSPVAFTVTLSANAPSGGVTVNYTTSVEAGDTATLSSTEPGGADFTAVSGQNITITSGSSTAVINVPTNGDTTDEPDETFTLTLNSATGADLGSPSVATGTITDNDDPPTLAIGSHTNVEEGETMNIPVMLSTASAKDVTVEYSVVPSGATGASEGNDFVSHGSSPTLDIPAGTTTANIVVVTIDDSIDEPSIEGIEVSVDDATNATLSSNATERAVIVFVTDNDDPPTATIQTSATVTEGGSLSFVVSLSSASGRIVNVAYAVTELTAVEGVDFENVPITANIEIPIGDSTGTISINTLEDQSDEDNETFILTLLDGVNHDLPATGITSTATITDDDDPPTANIAASATEEGDAIEFAVTLLPVASGKNVSVLYAAISETDDTASAGTDYTPPTSGASLDFDPGTTSLTFSMATTEDALDEYDETFTVRLSSPTNATLGTSTAKGTIEDDDPEPTMSVADVTEVEGTSLSFTVNINAVSGRDVSIDYGITGGDATSGSDYTALSDGTATISAGSTSTQFSIATTDDALDEEDEETIEITLSNVVNATLGNSTVTGGIQDNDLPPTINLSSQEVSEGNTLSFTATLTAVSGRDLSVEYSTTADTATPDVDYTSATNVSLVFNAGDISESIDIASIQDDTDEADETFTVTLGNPTNVTLGTSTATGTISNDDPDPVVSLALSQSSISELSGNSSVTATLDRPSGEPTTVTVAAQPVAPTVLADYTLVGTTLTIPTGQLTSGTPVQLNSVDNPYDGPDLKTITISGTSANPLGSVDPNDVTLSITDDEIPATSATLSLSGVTNNEVSEQHVPVDLVVHAALDGPARTESVPLSIHIVGITAGTGDFIFRDSPGSLELNSPLTIPALQAEGEVPVPMRIFVDSIDESNETMQISGSGAGLDIEPILLTILDVDESPTIELVLSPASIPDDGSSSTVTAELDQSSGADTVVTVVVNPVDGAPASAISLSQNTELTIPAGSTQSTGAVTITAVDDAVANEARSYAVTATATNDIGINLPEVQTLTVTDTEQASTAIVLTVEPTRIAENASAEDRTITVTATLDGDGRADATELTLTVTGGTAVEGTDFVAVDDFVLTIPATESSGEATFEFEPIDDTIDESDETFTISGPVSADGLTVQPSGGLTLTIEDDDVPPTVSLTLTPATIAEDGGSSVVTASLNAPASATISVVVSASPGTDATTDNYALSFNQTLSIAAGSTSSTGTVTVAAVDDGIDAPTRSVIISGQASSSVALVQPDSQILTITDDDDPPTQATLSLSINEIDEADVATIVTVTADLLESASSEPIDLTISVDPESASTGDFTAVPDFVLTVEPEQTSGTATFRMIPVNDATDEPNETVTVSGTGLPTVDSATLTIVDNDASPIPTLTLTPESIVENGGVTAVRAVLNHPSSADTTITVSAAAVSPATTADYTLGSNNTLSIPANATISSGDVSITAVDNDVSGPAKEITISGVATNSLGIANIDDQTLTITDNETESTGLTLTLSGATNNGVDEGVGTAELTVTATLNGSPLANILEVTLSVAGITASTDDFEAIEDFTLTVPPGQQSGSATFTFSPVDDDFDESEERVSIVGSTESDLVVSPSGGLILTIEDNDEPLAVTLALSTASIDENGGTTEISAVLSRAIVDDVSVTVQIAAVTPATDEDFVIGGSLSLTIPAGDTTSDGAVMVTAVDNEEFVQGKRIEISGIAAAGTRVINQPQDLILRIDEDDIPSVPTLSIEAVNTEVAEGGAAEFLVSVTPVSDTTLVINIEVQESGEMIAGTKPLSVTLPAGDSSVVLSIATDDDDVVESNSDVRVELTAGSDYEIGSPSEANVTVTDNDHVLPRVTIATTVGSTIEGEDLSFVVSTDTAPTSNVTVNVSISESGNMLSDTLISAIELISGQTTASFTVKTVDDETIEDSSTVTVSLRNGDDYVLGIPSSVSVTVSDDDAPPPAVLPSISITAVTTPVVEGVNAEFTIAVSETQSNGMNVNINVTETGSMLKSTPPAHVTIAGGTNSATFSLATDNDDADESDSDVTVSLATGVGYELGEPTSATVKVTDDDVPPPTTLPSISIAAVNASVIEGTDAEFAITISESQTSDLIIDIDVTETGDMLANIAPSQVTISSSTTNTVIKLTTVDDDVDEMDSDVSMYLVAGTGYQLGTPSTATVMVSDNDVAHNIPATGRPTISGTPSVEQTLTVNTTGITDDNGLTNATFEFQWIRTDSELIETEIPGATSSNYTVTSSDVDHTLKVRVDFSDDLGYAESVTSAATQTVAAPINQAPIANDDTAMTTAGMAVTVDVLANDSDPDGDSLSISLVTDGNNGVTMIAGSGITYQPNDDFDGTDVFTYTVSDGALTASATVMVTVAPVADETATEHLVTDFGQNAILNTMISINTRMYPTPAVASTGTTTQIDNRVWRNLFGLAEESQSSYVKSGFGVADPLIGNVRNGGFIRSKDWWLDKREIGALGWSSDRLPRTRSASTSGIGERLLRNGAFIVANENENDEPHGIWTLWGQTAMSGSSNNADGFSYESDVLSGTLGLDYERSRVLIGLAGSYSEGSSEYLLDGTSSPYEYEATMTSLFPYVKLAISDSFSIWSAHGRGSGEIRLMSDQSLQETVTDFDTSSIGFGFNGRLRQTAGGLSLGIKSDALLTDVTADQGVGLEEMRSDARRFRLMLETSKTVRLSSNGGLSTGIEAGVRYDDGTAEVGQGGEIGLFMRYTSPTGRVLWNTSVRSLVAHEEEDYEDWSAQFTLAIRSRATGLGPSFNLRSSWGVIDDGINSIWSRENPIDYVRRYGFDDPSNVDAELAYAFPSSVGHLLYKPYVGTSIFGRNGGGYRVGIRLSRLPFVQLQLEGVQRSQLPNEGSMPTLELRYSIIW